MMRRLGLIWLLLIIFHAQPMLWASSEAAASSSDTADNVFVLMDTLTELLRDVEPSSLKGIEYLPNAETLRALRKGGQYEGQSLLFVPNSNQSLTDDEYNLISRYWETATVNCLGLLPKSLQDMAVEECARADRSDPNSPFFDFIYSLGFLHIKPESSVSLREPKILFHRPEYRLLISGMLQDGDQPNSLSGREHVIRSARKAQPFKAVSSLGDHDIEALQQTVLIPMPVRFYGVPFGVAASAHRLAPICFFKGVAKAHGNSFEGAEHSAHDWVHAQLIQEAREVNFRESARLAQRLKAIFVEHNPHLLFRSGELPASLQKAIEHFASLHVADRAYSITLFISDALIRSASEYKMRGPSYKQSFYKTMGCLFLFTHEDDEPAVIKGNPYAPENVLRHIKNHVVEDEDWIDPFLSDPRTGLWIDEPGLEEARMHALVEDEARIVFPPKRIDGQTYEFQKAATPSLLEKVGDVRMIAADSSGVILEMTLEDRYTSSFDTHDGEKSITFEAGEVLRVNIFSGKVIDYGEAEDKNKLLALAGMALTLDDIPETLNPWVARERGKENVRRVRRSIRDLCDVAQDDMRRRLEHDQFAPASHAARLKWSPKTDSEYLEHVQEQVRTSATAHGLTPAELTALERAALQAIDAEFNVSSLVSTESSGAYSEAAASSTALVPAD